MITRIKPDPSNHHPSIIRVFRIFTYFFKSGEADMHIYISSAGEIVTSFIIQSKLLYSICVGPERVI